MDNPTRRFYALIRKIQRDIHHAIDELRLIAESCDPDHEEYSRDSNSDKPEENGEVFSTIKSLRIDQDSAEAKKYALDHRRYRLEWKGFRLGKWGTFVLAIYTALTALIAYQSTRSADAAHDAVTRSNRPWVGIDSVRITAPISFIPAGTEPDITYFVQGSMEMTVKNYGTSPALSVGTYVEAYDPAMFFPAQGSKANPGDPLAPLRKFGEYVCAMADGLTKQSQKQSGGSIFPTQTTIYDMGIPGFSKRDIQSGHFIQLVGCSSYRDQFGEMTHHTRYCFIAAVGKLGSVNNCESNSDAD